MRDIEVRVGADDDDPQPLCAHCKNEMDVVNDRRSHWKLPYNLHVFSCPHCHKVLGIGTLVK